MFCPECEQSNPIGNNFCGNCGSALPQRSKPPLRESVPPPGVVGARVDAPERTDVTEPIADGPHMAADVSARNQAAGGAEQKEPLAAKVPALAPEEQSHIRESAQRIDERTRENQAKIAPRTSPPSFAGYGGASILGLQDSDDNRETDYLLDDAPRRGVNWIAVVGIALLLAVAGGMLAAWRQAGFDGIRQSASEFWRQRIMKERQSAAKPGAESRATAEQNTQAEQNGSASSGGYNTADSAQPGTTQPTITAENSSSGASANLAAESASDASGGMPESDQASAADKKNSPAGSNKTSTPVSVAGSQTAKSSDEADASTASTTADGEAKTHVRAGTASKPRPEPAQDIYEKGQNYLFGRGVPQSCAQGVIFTKAAAREGSFRAATQLGALYATGRCVEVDRVQAYHWFSQAQQLEPTNSWVEKNRDSLWAQMSEQERAKAGQE